MKRALRFVGRAVNIIPVGWELTDEKWLKLKEAVRQKEGDMYRTKTNNKLFTGKMARETIGN